VTVLGGFLNVFTCCSEEIEAVVSAPWFRGYRHTGDPRLLTALRGSRTTTSPPGTPGPFSPAIWLRMSRVPHRNRRHGRTVASLENPKGAEISTDTPVAAVHRCGRSTRRHSALARSRHEGVKALGRHRGRPAQRRTHAARRGPTWHGSVMLPRREHCARLVARSWQLAQRRPVHESIQLFMNSPR